MPDLAATPTFRLTVRGAAGSVDLAVPPWADVESLGREYAEATGHSVPPVLVTTTGRPLDPSRPLHQLPVAPGDVLVALDPEALAPRPPDSRSTPSPTTGPGPGPGPARPVLVGASVVCAVAACLAGALSPSGPLRVASVMVLLLAALASTLVAPAARGTLRTAHAMAAPAFAGAAGYLLVHSSATGGDLLALAVASTSAGVAAAVVRAGADARLERLLRVWLVVAGGTAVSAAVALAVGLPGSSLWVLMFFLAVVAARLLPYLVVDVPDEVLLDIDRLAVTAWSAREAPRRGRRRVAVRGVSSLLRQGRDLLVAGAVAVAAVATAATVSLVLEPRWGVEALGVHLLLLFGGAALALTARSYRAAVPRAALRLPAALALTAVLVVGLQGLSGSWLWWSLGGLGAAAPAVVAAAVSLGQGLALRLVGADRRCRRGAERRPVRRRLPGRRRPVRPCPTAPVLTGSVPRPDHSRPCRRSGTT